MKEIQFSFSPFFIFNLVSKLTDLGGFDSASNRSSLNCGHHKQPCLLPCYVKQPSLLPYCVRQPSLLSCLLPCALGQWWLSGPSLARKFFRRLFRRSHRQKNLHPPIYQDPKTWVHWTCHALARAILVAVITPLCQMINMLLLHPWVLLMSPVLCLSIIWILNSGATNHMTPCSSYFSSYSTLFEK